jgi:hypothetical protein
MSTIKNYTLKTNLIFCTAMTLSIGTIVAMENEHHIVTIYNMLSKSPISINSPTQYYISGQKELQNKNATIKTENWRQFLLPAQNNTSQLKILLPYCYKDPIVDVSINKKEESIYIRSKSSDASKEMNIIISNTNKDLITREASMNPAQYHTAKLLVLQELASQQK